MWHAVAILLIDPSSMHKDVLKCSKLLQFFTVENEIFYLQDLFTY